MAVTVASVFVIIKGVIEIVQAAITLGKFLYNAAKQAKREGWIQEGREVTKKIKELKTDAERREMVKKLAKHFSDMP